MADPLVVSLSNHEQRSRARGPQRGSRVGVGAGCSAGRMQTDFHHGLQGQDVTLDEQELRAIVREAIARHFGHPARVPQTGPVFGRCHVSHVRLPLTRGDEGDRGCLIEPTARCGDCGFCQSYGH